MSTIVWGDKTLEVRQAYETTPQHVKVNDFVVYCGELLKVITVQRDCPSLEKLSHRFTMFTLLTSNNEVVPARNLFGKVTVIKEKKRYQA